MTLRWDAITSGEAFQSFAGQLVLHLDPGARVFTWPGPDGGQDALSEDGTVVYQAKHHARADAKQPRQDALRELEKIRRYREPGHARHARWASVRRWILLTNVATQTSEPERWDEDVVPTFRDAGLAAEVWGAERLERHVSDFPALKHAFFDGETRSFVSLGEALHHARASDLAARDGELPTLRDRDPLVGDVIARIRDHAIVPLIAPAGVGSSRLALEVAIRAVHSEFLPAAYFANPANLETDARWYAAFVPEHPMLVVLDELDDDDGVQIVKRLREEMKTRAAAWRVLVVTKPHQRRIRSALLGAPSLAEPLEVGPISRDAAAALVDETVRRRVRAELIIEPELARGRARDRIALGGLRDVGHGLGAHARHGREPRAAAGFAAAGSRGVPPDPA